MRKWVARHSCNDDLARELNKTHYRWCIYRWSVTLTLLGNALNVVLFFLDMFNLYLAVACLVGAGAIILFED